MWLSLLGLCHAAMLTLWCFPVLSDMAVPKVEHVIKVLETQSANKESWMTALRQMSWKMGSNFEGMDLSSEKEWTWLSTWKCTEMKTDMFWITFHGFCLQGKYYKVKKRKKYLSCNAAAIRPRDIWKLRWTFIDILHWEKWLRPLQFTVKGLSVRGSFLQTWEVVRNGLDSLSRKKSACTC